MDLYTVEVTEVLQRQVEVFAKNPLHAWEVVEDLYRNAKIVLNESDLISQQTNVLNV